MAELSYLWGGIITGDCGPYTDDVFTDLYRIMFSLDRTIDGVIQNYLNKLEVTTAVASVDVDTGGALVDGKPYINDSSENVAIPVPAVSNRYDRIVLRKTWLTQTVRITRIAGVEGGGVPALDQTDGTTWDLPLATVYVTTLGAITVTDNRYWCISPLSEIYKICEGRLTLTTATPITTADVTAATTIYFTPYKGNKIGLHDGDNWRVYTFTERSLSIAGYNANKPFDVWLYNNAGVLTLDTTEWTNTTTRATAIALQDGIYVKSGDTTRRYLGTICTTGSAGQTEDSVARRLVWNYYNRAPRKLYCFDTTNTWTYTTATFREANGASTDGTSRFSVVIGVNEDAVRCENHNFASNSNGAAVFCTGGIGLDSTSVQSAHLINGANSANGQTFFFSC